MQSGGIGKMEKLKPCPFCGSENVKMGSVSFSFGADIYVKCDCGAKVQICEEHGEKELVKRWNSRH